MPGQLGRAQSTASSKLASTATHIRQLHRPIPSTLYLRDEHRWHFPGSGGEERVWSYPDDVHRRFGNFVHRLGRVADSVILPPFTETFGRKKTYVSATLLYSITTLIVGVIPNVAGAVVGRVLSVALSAVGGSVAAGSMEDMYDTEARIWAVFVWSTAAVSGLAIGPIYGSYIAHAIGWYVVALYLYCRAQTVMGSLTQALGFPHRRDRNLRRGMRLSLDHRESPCAHFASRSQQDPTTDRPSRSLFRRSQPHTPFPILPERRPRPTIVFLLYGVYRHGQGDSLGHCLGAYFPSHRVLHSRLRAGRLHLDSDVAFLTSGHDRSVLEHSCSHARPAAPSAEGTRQ